ncbi:hypothetical protein VKT23_008176 [Stygiomarasmius scandens]|uniref:Uncharacterized protein n=1 Tax=Marasmiellus scandens TaxID=2682957 RepID=A0ABR1JIB6_9AGAR
MPRRSNAATSRAEGAKKAREKRTVKDIQPIVAVHFGAAPIFASEVSSSAELNNESDTDSVNEIINRFVTLEESGVAPECKSDIEVDDDEEDIVDESQLSAFAKVLERAQQEANMREKATKARKPNRPSTYTGNAPRTICEHAAKRKKFVATGGKLISDFFRPASEEPDKEGGQEVSSDSELEVQEVPAPNTQAVRDIAEPQPFDWNELQLADPHANRIHLNQLFNELKQLPDLHGPDTRADAALNTLHYRDWPALRKAAEGLSRKVKDKKLDVVFHARITAMLGALNLYLDCYTTCTWKQASFLAARSQGKSVSYAQKIHTWLHRFLSHGELPMHHYGRFHASILNDEDIRVEIKDYLLERSKRGYIFAKDIVELIASDEMQKKLQAEDGKLVTISVRTAQHWFRKLDWHRLATVRAMTPLAPNRTRTGPEVQVQWLCRVGPGPVGSGRGPVAEHMVGPGPTLDPLRE